MEEFRARKLASMMAFDAGEYEWTNGKVMGLRFPCWKYPSKVLLV